MQVSQQEEKQSISQKTEAPVIVKPEKPASKFTKKQQYCILSIVVVLALGTAIGLTIYFTRKDNYIAITVVNQRDDFTQKDEICVYHENQVMQNCTEVHINTTRVTVAQDGQNTTNLIMLQGFKVNQYTMNDDGTKNYTDLTEVNSLIEQNLQTRLRFLQSTNSSDYCYNISASECGSIDSVPLLTFVTDTQTGQINSIGIPSGVDDSLVQPLVSSIVHIGANTQNTTEATPSNGTRRMLVSDFKNLYRIGQLTFLPKYSVTKKISGEVVITKKITKSDNIGNEDQMKFFQQFDQQQDTVLDINSKLSSSRIQTFSIIDNSITSSDPSDINQKDQTQIQSDSNLVTISTNTDADLTTALNDVQSKQTVQYYSISELKDKLSTTNQVTQSVEIDQSQSTQTQTNDTSNSQTNDTSNTQTNDTFNTQTSSSSNDNSTQSTEQTQENNGGNRFLADESGNIGSSGDASFSDNLGECNKNSFNQSRKLKEVTVLGQKVALNTEFQGQTNGKDASGYLRTCVTLNGSCVYQLQKNDFAFSGKSVPNLSAGNSKNQNLFKVSILLLGYPVNVGADLAYSWGFSQQNIKTDTQMGLTEGVYAAVSLTAYGEINIIWLINIRAGVNGVIFKGSLNGKVLFAYDKPTGLINPNKYLITLDFQMQALTFDVYASYNHIQLSWVRHCIGRRWWKICWYIPQMSYSGWRDIYRKTFQLAPTLNTNVLFRVKSKCYT